jgi:prolyl-tRNA synthetase
VSLAGNDADINAFAEAVYEELTDAGKSVLYDDRDLRAGEKFADSDLIGIPWRIVVGRDAVPGGVVELVNRSTGEVLKLSREELLAR